MQHTHSRIWIHLIWTTKNRQRCLFKDYGIQLYNHLITYTREEIKVPFERLNIQPEHIHGLIDLPTNVLLSDLMRKLKGESSYWMNQNKILKNHFSWQRGFGAYSVSASQIGIVKRYIENQQNHHARKTFADEYEEWKKKYGIYNI
ncbi:MAG: IS200/IS605 family transposase [Bacteroidales bacterium]|nr:IS200/IS605 family transposase [Bacteroidales bacterium]